MEISWDIIFFIIIGLVILTCYCQSTDEKFENIANADIEAIRNLNNIAAKLTAGKLTTPGNMTVTGDLGVGPTIAGSGRLHITGPELLYILNKNGVMIGKEWGGSGDLSVQGNTNVGGSIAAGGDINPGNNINLPNGKTIAGAGRMHISTGELLYLLPKNGVIIGKEWGGNGDLSVQGTLNVQGRDIIGELNAIKAQLYQLNPVDGVVKVGTDMYGHARSVHHFRVANLNADQVAAGQYYAAGYQDH